MLNNQYDFVFKILLIGDSSVGKSSLLLRFSDDTFSDSFLPTIGVDFKIRTLQSSGSIVKLQMWDTAGQQRFKTITAAYYKGAQGIILVYDITDRQSFLNVQSWLLEAQKYAKEDTVKILIGNKADLESNRAVQKKEAKQFAQSLGMQYLQTSAKNSFNVQKTFSTLSDKMKQKYVSLGPKIINPLQKVYKKKGCC